MATRVLNLLSGLIVMVTGVYTGWHFVGVMPDTIRWMIVALSLLYFVLRIVRFLRAEWSSTALPAKARHAGNLELDNGWQ